MIDFKFADIGEGIHEGQILKWLFEEGDKVEEGDTIVVVETDKVNAEIPAPESGILKKRGAEVGETIHVGETLALIDDGSDETKVEDPSGEASKDAPKDEEQAEESDEDEEKKSETAGEAGASVVGSVEVSDDVIEASNEHEGDEEESESKQVLATPVARKMAKDLGVDITKLEGSGPNGRVMKADIESAADSSEASQASPKKTQSTQQTKTYAMPKLREEGTRREKISSLRKSIVKAMDTSNTLIPATTVMDEFDVTELVQFRNEQKSLAETMDTKLTYLPLIMKAIILTIKKYPIFNASFDHEAEEIVYKDYFNIGIAVDTENGLVVPNVKDADRKSIFELGKITQDLAAKAREKKLTMDDLRDTTFSITNYGAFGSKLGTPVINHPEVAILGMGAITKQPVVIDDEVKVRHMFPVSLTIDHRVIDGGDAGRFMVELKRYLSNPMLLLLS